MEAEVMSGKTYADDSDAHLVDALLAADPLLDWTGGGVRQGSTPPGPWRSAR